MISTSQCEGKCSDGSRCKRMSGAGPRCYQHQMKRGSAGSSPGSAGSSPGSPIYTSPIVLGGFSPRYRGESPPVRNWESPEVYFRPRRSPSPPAFSPATPPAKYRGYGAVSQRAPEGRDGGSPPGYSVRKKDTLKRTKRAKAKKAKTAKKTKSKTARRSA